MSAKSGWLLRLLALGVIAASLAACAADPPSADPPMKTVVDPSLRPGVPDSMMRSDGTMINGLLPLPPYY